MTRKIRRKWKTRRLLHLQVSKTENEKELLKLRGYEKREKGEGKGKWINEKSLNRENVIFH